MPDIHLTLKIDREEPFKLMRSMRDFVKEAEEKGLCKRITAEVDWNLELSHIAKLNEEQGGPALLFENVKDYETPVITSVCTTPGVSRSVEGPRVS